MLQNVSKSAANQVRDLNTMLLVVHKAITPVAPPELSRRCRFDMFVRKKPGEPGFNSKKGPQRTWCLRGDKYATEDHQMIRKLLNHLQKDISKYDRVILYDNHKAEDERILLKITDGLIETNHLNKYQLMLINYSLPDYLK
jgi:hypothetical protein